MNERIKELWNQAAKSTAAFPSGQNNSWETQVNFMEKFANLIVQECIAQCEKNAEHSYLGPGSKLSAFNIKEHFGVE